MKATNVFLVIIFKTCLQPYLKLVTIGMTRYSFIKHKEVIVIYEESGLIMENYNILIINLEFKLIAQPIVIYTTIK